MTEHYLDKVYGRVDFDRELVFKFFAVFSLFEYSLKSAGFRNQSGDAVPDWEKFARTIQRKFNPQVSDEVAEAVKYLVEKPPMRQTIDQGRLKWVERMKPEGKTDCEWLSLIVRAVRNNLFHGGKFVYQRPRDTLLIQHSLTVLEAWAQCDGRIGGALERLI